MPSDTITHLIGGGLAGLISDGVVHPIDTVRARLMISAPGESQSATRCMLNIFKREGVGSLYKGFSAVALGTFPGHALYFAGYEFAKKHLNAAFNVPDDSSFLVHFASGFFADVCGALTWTPMDVVKQRLQVQRQHTSALRIESNYSGSVDVVKRIVRQDGLKGLFRGMGAGLLTYGPYVSLYFAIYEQTKIFAASKLFDCRVTELPFYIFLTGAALAGSLSAAITCPLDVIKTRIQVQTREHASNQLKYRNAWQALKLVVREEGYAALMYGIRPRVLWMAGGTTVTMVAYEEIKKAVSWLKQ